MALGQGARARRGPGGGSTSPPSGGAVLAQARTSWSISPPSRARPPRSSRARPRALGVASPSKRAAPAWTRITLIAWPAESCRSRAIRVRSSAAARRRSRSASRSARRARSSSSAMRSRRWRAVAGDPGAAPDEAPNRSCDDGELASPPRRRRDGDGPATTAPSAERCARRVGDEAEEEEGDRRADRRARGVVEAAQAALASRDGEDGERRAPPATSGSRERQRGARRARRGRGRRPGPLRRGRGCPARARSRQRRWRRRSRPACASCPSGIADPAAVAPVEGSPGLARGEDPAPPVGGGAGVPSRGRSAGRRT